MFLKFSTRYPTHLKCCFAVPPLCPFGGFLPLLKTMIKCPQLSSLCFPNMLYAHALNISQCSDLPISLIFCQTLVLGNVSSSAETSTMPGVLYEHLLNSIIEFYYGQALGTSSVCLFIFSLISADWLYFAIIFSLPCLKSC